MKHIWSDNQDPLVVICTRCGRPLVPKDKRGPYWRARLGELRVREDCVATIVLEAVEDGAMKTFDIFIRIQTVPEMMARDVNMWLSSILDSGGFQPIASRVEEYKPVPPAEEEKKK